MCDTGYTVKELASDLRELRDSGLDEPTMLEEMIEQVKRLLLMKHNWLRGYMMTPPPENGPLVRHKLHEEPDHSLFVIVVTMGAGRETPPHDHGTWAIVAGLEGEEIQRTWREAGEGVTATGEQRIDPATIISVRTGEIHSLHNGSASPSVTLQVYGTNPEFTTHRNFTPRR